MLKILKGLIGREQDDDGTLRWERAGTDELGDQYADSGLGVTGYGSVFWVIGPGDEGLWEVDLIGDDGSGNALLGLGGYATEQDAKDAAQRYEDSHKP